MSHLITFTDTPVPTHVLALIEEFSQTPHAKLCSTRDGAFANCGSMSVYFVKWLRRRGIRAGMIRLRNAPPYGEAHERWMMLGHMRENWQHHIVVLHEAGLYVDFTHRQFVPYSPFPVIADSPTWWKWGDIEISWDGLGRALCDGIYHGHRPR